MCFTIIGLLCILIPANIISAGSINANEAGVLSVAQGTFEYKGKMYVAKRTYISQLSGKLSKDDVDLTAAQAQEAIGKIMSNVGNGVANGYLKRVTQAKDKKESQNKKDGTTIKKEIETRENISVSNNNVDVQAQVTSAQPVTGSAVTGSTIKLDLSSLQGNSHQVKRTQGSDVYKNVRSCQQKVKHISCIVLVVLIIGLSIYMHKRYRRKMKVYIISAIGFVLICVGLFMVVGSYNYQHNMYSRSSLKTKIIETGYFREINGQLSEEITNIEQLTGLPQGVLGVYLTEEKVYRDGKMLLDRKLYSNSNEQFSIQSEIVDQVSRYVSGQTQSVQQLAQYVNSSYGELLNFDYADVIAKEESSQKTAFLITLITGFALILFGLVLLFVKITYKHRVVRLLAYGVLANALAMIIATCIFKLSGYTQYYLIITPKYYQNFFRDYLNGMITNTFFVGLGELTLWLFLVLVVRRMKNSLRQ